MITEIHEIQAKFFRIIWLLYFHLLHNKCLWFLLWCYGPVRIRKVLERDYVSWSSLRFQIKHGVKQCTTCQRTNWHRTTKHMAWTAFVTWFCHCNYNNQDFIVISIISVNYHSVKHNLRNCFIIKMRLGHISLINRNLALVCSFYGITFIYKYT